MVTSRGTDHKWPDKKKNRSVSKAEDGEKSRSNEIKERLPNEQETQAAHLSQERASRTRERLRARVMNLAPDEEERTTPSERPPVPVIPTPTSAVEPLSRKKYPSTIHRKRDVCEACLSGFDENDTERPRHNITLFCPHPPNFCISCLGIYIKSTVKDSTNGVVLCPGNDTYGCEEELSPNEIRAWADEATYEEYDNIMLREALKAQKGFIHCPYKDKENPSKQCQSGHIHEEGGGNYVLCPKCERPYCAKHKVTWHHEESCDDYDNRSQSGYRTLLDRAREAEETHLRRIQRSSEDAAVALSLRQAGESMRELNDEAARMKLKRADEMKRKIDERRHQEEKERQERDRKNAKEREKRVKEAQRRRKENKESEAAVDKSSKPCPACGCPTQKIMGCDAMQCTAKLNLGEGKFRTGTCSTAWCWKCGKEIIGYFRPGLDGHWQPRGCDCHPPGPPGFGPGGFDPRFDPRFGGGPGFSGGFYRDRRFGR